MSNYLGLIERAPLVRQVKSSMTTGDVEYPGTALEIRDEAGKDLFHVVVDSRGEQQVLFFGGLGTYRVPLELLEQIIARAREVVVASPGEESEGTER